MGEYFFFVPTRFFVENGEVIDIWNILSGGDENAKKNEKEQGSCRVSAYCDDD